MVFKRALFVFTLVLPFAIAMESVGPIDAAESTTGVLVGEVLDGGDRPIVHARVAAASPSGSAQTQADANGRFTILGLVPDTYTLSAQAPGFESRSIVAVVLAGQTQRIVLALLP